MARDPPPTAAERPVTAMVKPTGPACNLECAYCYYLETADLYPERSGFAMSEETLETFVRQYIEAQPGPVVTFAWQGGEPTLLGVEFFRRALELQERYAPDGVRVRNTLQTNGTLLDGEWGRFLADEDFLVGISVDGPRRLHDRFRRTRAGGPTFDRVASGLDVLEEHGVEHNVLCVVNSVNSRHPLDVYEFFRARGIEWVQFVPLVEPLDVADRDAADASRAGGDGETPGHRVPDWVRARGGAVDERDPAAAAVAAAARSAPVTDRSVDPVAYGEFLCTVFDEWVRNDVGDLSVRLFDQCLETRFRGEASLCVFRETCGSQVAVEHNGDVYACDHYVDAGFRRGNLHETHLAELADSPEQRRFETYKRDGLPPRCRTCDVRSFCHGGCPKNRHLATPDGDLGLNYLCAGYRRFFTYVRPYLDVAERVLASGRPLSAVERAVAALD